MGSIFVSYPKEDKGEESRAPGGRHRSLAIGAGALIILFIVSIWIGYRFRALPDSQGVQEASPTTTREQARRETWTDPVLSMEFVPIGPGVFWMGSPETEVGHSGDEQRHRVELTQGFWMGRTEVTQAQFEKFVGETGYKSEAEQDGRSYGMEGSLYTAKEGVSWKNSGGPEYPVTHVSWNDAQEFCQWLSGRVTGTIRLPTEAEWEYAARAGTETATYRGDLTDWERSPPEFKDIAWCAGNSGMMPHPVGKKFPNEWGLYDMLGNALEWVADWYGEYPESSEGTVVQDPTGAQRGALRVLRGGSWYGHALHCRAALRGSMDPRFRDDSSGFRLVRELTIRTENSVAETQGRGKGTAQDGKKQI